MKAEVHSTNQYSGALGMIRRCNRAVAPVIRCVYPVVDPVAWVRDSRFRVYFRKACVKDLSNVSLAVAIVVLHPENIRRRCYDESTLPWLQSADLQDLIGKDGSAFIFPIAVCVFEELDA